MENYARMIEVMKRIHAALAIPVLALSLSACGGNKAAEPETEPAQSEAVVVEEAEPESEEVVVVEEEPVADVVTFTVTSTAGGTAMMSIDGSSISEPIEGGEWVYEAPADEVKGVVTLSVVGDATGEQTVTCSISDGSGVLKEATATGTVPTATCAIPSF